MPTEMRESEQQPAEPLDQLLEYGRGNGYQLDWLRKRETWGNELHPDMEHGGLRLQDAEVGPFGEVPDVSDNETGRPRGALRREDAPRVGSYRVKSKSEIWMRNAAALYEEALTRQWSSATDVPWETLKPLPDDIERAECELATFLSDVEFVAGDVPGRWISDTSPDFFEPRMFLVSQIMDEARHLDVFRKRALANGGGLMQQSRAFAGGFGSSIDNARDFTEMSVRLHISGEGLILSVFRMGERMAYNDAEKEIYRLCGSDESRHVAFGVMHLRYLAEAEPERKEEIHCLLDEVEAGLAIGEGTSSQNLLTRVGSTGSSLAVLLGAGNIEEGEKLAQAMRQRQIKEYIQRVKVSGFGERFENGRSGPVLMKYVAG
ncbi:MAG: hypothetical protein QF681_09495 [Vicinamibacterales bacterium]|jgi:hypothetical protein|nr:hypothetical protein [Vicinamibacterales bacterium]